MTRDAKFPDERPVADTVPIAYKREIEFGQSGDQVCNSTLWQDTPHPIPARDALWFSFRVSIRNLCDGVLASARAVGCDTLARGAGFAAGEGVCCAA